MGAPNTNLQHLNFDKMVGGKTLEQLRDRVESLCGQSVTYWAADKNVRWSDTNETGSYAVVVKVVDKGVDLIALIDDPNAWFDFAFYVGRDGRQFAAKALRKLRATIRTGRSTQQLRELGGSDPFARFENVVGVEDDSELLWGEFPYAGAAIVECKDGRRVAVAYSGFKQQDDHWLAKLTAEHSVLFFDEAAEAARSTEEATTPEEAVETMPVPGAVG